MKTRKDYFMMMIGLVPFLGLMAMANVAMLESQRVLLRLLAINFVIIIVLAVGIYYNLVAGHKLALNKLLFLTITLTLSASVAFIFQNQTFLLFPLLIGTMLITVVLSRELALMWHTCLLIIVGVVTGQGLVYYSYFLLMGYMMVYAMDYIKERHLLLQLILGLSLVSGMLYFLLDYIVYDLFMMTQILIATFVAGISIVLVIGSLPMWESLFGVMTPLKMMEYISGNHKLLQRLLVEAPGTYHHVQMVANLSGQGARAIGADEYLAKAGALYHDIGKMKDPEFFIENQNGRPNPHDDLAADASAAIIIDHVAYGVKLAKDHKLPGPIIDIIKQHHGDSLVTYFYHKAQNYHDGVLYEEALFRYPGPIPKSKEAAIVMLADCVEAYVRSLGEADRHMDRIKVIIDDVLAGKIADHQLTDAGIGLAELKKVQESFMEVYNGLYHDRVKYPTNKEV